MLALQCGPWARLAGAGEPIPASSPPDLAGEELGRVLGMLGARFGALYRAVVAPVRQLSGARECGCGGDRSRRGGGAVGAKGGRGSLVGACGHSGVLKQ
jgi:hypothetical protein